MLYKLDISINYSYICDYGIFIYIIYCPIP